MSTTPSLNALRDASPRNQPDFDALLERYEQLGSQITSTPPVPAGRSRRPAPRRRLIGLSFGFAAAAALAIAVGGVTLGGGSPQSAFAAAHKALAATSAQRSGTMTLTVNGAKLSTLRWNDHRIALTKDQSSPLVLGHVLGPNLQMLLIGGGAYVQGPNGSWTHYASVADVGDSSALKWRAPPLRPTQTTRSKSSRSPTTSTRPPGRTARRCTPAPSATPTSTPR